MSDNIDRMQVFVDMDCPMCSREVCWLQSKGADEQMCFVPLDDESIDPSKFGVTAARMNRYIHALLPNGQVISGVEVFRQMYDRLGYTRLVALSRAPVISQMLSFGYFIFAFLRIPLGALWRRLLR